jgi:hypothetical protein
MTEAREFDLTAVLAMTHGYPILLEPYLEIMAYLNQRPASTVDSRTIPAAWIFHLHPVLRRFTAPDVSGVEPTERDLAVWDAWAADVQIQVGARLALSPIPPDVRDQRSLVELLLDRGADLNKIWLIDPSKPGLGLDAPDDQH